MVIKISHQNQPNMEEERRNTTFNFLRTILLELCVNFNEKFMPTDNWSCEFRNEYYYKLRALKGKTLKLTTLQRPPLSGTIVQEDGSLRGTGVAFELIHNIQEKVGFFYNITLPNENAIGNENSGIIGLLNNKEVDMAVAFIPTMQVFDSVISYSAQLAEFEWVLFMARPSASASGSGLLAPFQLTVWMFILVSLIIAGPTMYLVVFIRRKFYTRTDVKDKPFPLGICYWFVYGALMRQGSTLSPVCDSSRLFFASWWIFITILTSFYTANLTAFLTLSQFTLTIQTTKDIYMHKRHWMADSGGYEEFMIVNENSFDYLKNTIPRYGHYITESLEQRLQRVQKGEIYVSEKRNAESIIVKDYLNKTRHYIPEKKRCTFVLTPRSILSKPVGFIYPKNSEIKYLLDPMLKYLVSSGIITHLLGKDLPIRPICPLNLASRERKLLNSDLVTTYKVVGVGFAVSSAAFIGEVIFRFCQKRTKPKQQKTQRKGVGNESTSLNNKMMVINEAASKPTLNDNFVVSQYYKEIVPFRYNEYNSEQDKNAGLIIPNNTSRNILFQYTN